MTREVSQHMQFPMFRLEDKRASSPLGPMSYGRLSSAVSLAAASGDNVSATSVKAQNGFRAVERAGEVLPMVVLAHGTGRMASSSGFAHGPSGHACLCSCLTALNL